MKTAESDSAYRLVSIWKKKKKYVQYRSTISPLHEKQVTLKLLIRLVFICKEKTNTVQC